MRVRNGFDLGPEGQFDAEFHSEIKNRNRLEVFRRRHELVRFELPKRCEYFIPIGMPRVGTVDMIKKLNFFLAAELAENIQIDSVLSHYEHFSTLPVFRKNVGQTDVSCQIYAQN